MTNKFEIGDRVRSKFYGLVGTITEIDTDGYILKPDTDDEMWIADTDVEPYDPKTAFLSDLANMLRKHNAVIDIAWWDKSLGIMATITDEKILLPIATEVKPAPKNAPWMFGEYNHTPLTADTIMNYDKE